MAVELVYFDARGLSEIIRITLAAADIQYKEVDLTTRDEYLALLPDLLFDQVPLLRIDGMKLVQSGAIVRYVARKGNLYGENSADDARIDMLYEGARDFYMKGFATMITYVPEEEAKKVAKEQIMPKYLPIFDKVLGENSSGFLVGKRLSLADLELFEALLAVIDYFGDEALDDFSNLKRFVENMKANEKLLNYVKNVRKQKNNPEIVKRGLAILSHLVPPGK